MWRLWRAVADEVSYYVVGLSWLAVLKSRYKESITITHSLGVQREMSTPSKHII